MEEKYTKSQLIKAQVKYNENFVRLHDDYTDLVDIIENPQGSAVNQIEHLISFIEQDI